MNYQNDRESNEYRVARRSFTVIGFACAGVLALNYGLNAAVIGICGRLSGKGIIPEGLFAEGSLSRLLLVTLTGFGIALPLAAFAVKKLLPAQASDGGSGLTSAPYELFCVVFTLAFIGSNTGGFFDSLIKTSSDSGSSSGMPAGAAGTAVYFAVIVIIVPLAEEFFFRKVLIDALSPWGDAAAIFFSALFGALYHGNITSIFTAFFEGLALGYIYAKNRKLIYPVAGRAAVNLIAGFLPSVVLAYVADIDEVNEISLRFAELTSRLPGSAAELKAFLPELSSAMPGILAVSAVNAVTGGIAFAGFFLLVSGLRRIRLDPGTMRLKRKEIGSTVFLSPGVLAFILLSILITVLSYSSFGSPGTGG